jgi:membrane fusion protein (multidrug efflux system)
VTTAFIILRRRLTAALAALALPVLAQAAPADPGVIVAEVRMAQLVDRIEALGTLRANESVELTATVTETVTAIHFDDGDRVEAGQVLVEMTSTEERALLEEARSTVDEARRQYRRVQSLESQGTAARSLLDERRRDWETARARLAAIESRLADRLIKAPFAGVVGLRDLSPGALVEPGDLITTLDDDSVMKLELTVPATYLDALEPGLPVAATARAYGPREFQGTVKAVDSRVDPATRSVRVRALIPNPQRLLKPGMLMQVELLEDARRAPVVPEEALMPEGRRHFVMVVDPQDGNRIARREIRIGARRPGEVEVVEGLEPGELVVTQGQLRVREGQQVRIQAVDDGTRPLRELVGEYEPEAAR